MSHTILKVLVGGTFSSGKTEFIKSISEIEVVSTESGITKEATQDKKMFVALDFGRITVDKNTILYLFGTPGARRFDFSWEIIQERLIGMIIMVNSAKPETFREVRFLIREHEAYAFAPYIVVANKQDKGDAWDTEALRIALQVPNHIPVVPCVAKDKQSVINVLIALYEEILRVYE